MTSWQAGWRFPLYLRIWIAVVVTVGLLTIAFGYLWSVNRQQVPMREVIIRNARRAMTEIGKSLPTEDQQSINEILRNAETAVEADSLAVIKEQHDLVEAAANRITAAMLSMV